MSSTIVKELKDNFIPQSNYHALEIQEVLHAFKTNKEEGLSMKEVDKRLNEYGPNEFEQGKKKSTWEKIKAQFEDFLVRLLLLAFVISFAAVIFGI